MRLPPPKEQEIVTEMTQRSSKRSPSRFCAAGSGRFLVLLDKFARCDHLVDNPELAGLLGRHDMISVKRPFDHIVFLAGMLHIDLVQTPLDANDVLGMTLDVGGLPLEAA